MIPDCATEVSSNRPCHAAETSRRTPSRSTCATLAAAYVFHIAENQPFVDGNKRAALASGLVFLHQNGIALDDPNERLYDVMIKIATKAIAKPEIAMTLRSLIVEVSD